MFSPKAIVQAVSNFLTEAPPATSAAEVAPSVQEYRPLESARSAPTPSSQVTSHLFSLSPDAASQVYVEQHGSMGFGPDENNDISGNGDASGSPNSDDNFVLDDMSYSSSSVYEPEAYEAAEWGPAEQSPADPPALDSGIRNTVSTSAITFDSHVIHIDNVRMASPRRYFAPETTPRPRCCTESAVIGVRPSLLEGEQGEVQVPIGAGTDLRSLASPRRASASHAQLVGLDRNGIAATQNGQRRNSFLQNMLPSMKGTPGEKSKKAKQLMKALERRDFAVPQQIHNRWTPAAQLGLSVVATSSTGPNVVIMPPRKEPASAESGSGPRKGIKRSNSFTGFTQLQHVYARQHMHMAAERKRQTAEARDRAEQAAKLSQFMGLLLLEALLILGYVLYRNVSCPAFDWQCQDKEWQQHYDDVSALMMIGGIMYATGPTVTTSLMFPCIVMYISGLLAFGALGEIPFMMNSLASAGTWEPPAYALYGSAALLVITMIVYSFHIARSRYDIAVSLLIVGALIMIYSSAIFAAVIAGVPVGSITYHPHHYMIAWHLCLLLRHPTDEPTVLMRWALLGVSTQGLSAYSAASMLSSE